MVVDLHHVVERLRGEHYAPSDPAGLPFRMHDVLFNSVLVLSVFAHDIGLDEEHTSFSYLAFTESACTPRCTLAHASRYQSASARMTTSGVCEVAALSR